MTRHIEEYQQDANNSAVAYESAVEIKDKCAALEKTLEPLYKFCNDTYPEILNVLKSMENDINEVDVYTEFFMFEQFLEEIEDTSARIGKAIGSASFKANKIIE